MTWRFIRRSQDLIITDWKLWWREVSGKIYEIGILAPEMDIVRRNAVVKNQETKQRAQRILGDCWQCEADGQCSEGDNCSFRHDVNKRAKMTQPNPSPNSFMQQDERNASRTRSPRGKSPSGRMSRWPCKDYFKGNLHQFILWKVAPSRMLVLQDKEWLPVWGKVLIRTPSGWWAT